MVGDRATAERERERAKRGSEDRPDLKKDDRSAIPRPQETPEQRDTGGGSSGGGDSKQRPRDDYTPPAVVGDDNRNSKAAAIRLPPARTSRPTNPYRRRAKPMALAAHRPTRH
jgi:hypothetical protein